MNDYVSLFAISTILYILIHILIGEYKNIMDTAILKKLSSDNEEITSSLKTRIVLFVSIYIVSIISIYMLYKVVSYVPLLWYKKIIVIFGVYILLEYVGFKKLFEHYI